MGKREIELLFIEDRYELCEDDIKLDRLYKAKDLETNSDVFIKVLNYNRYLKDNFIPDLIDETTVVFNIDSRKIAKILDIATDENTYYIVSEFFEGKSLFELVNNKDLKIEDITYITKQIISTLKLCDERGLYHGALRLDNILVNDDYDIKIYDLGITKANGGVNIRMNDNISFLCPHQLNVNYTDRESDFFAIGVIIYYCLFKEMPFKIEKDEFKMLRNIDKGIDLDKNRKTALNKGLIDIIKKLFDRKEKYKGYDEILIDLTKIMYLNANIVETNTKNLNLEQGDYVIKPKNNSFLIKIMSIVMCIIILVMVILQL